MIIRIGQGLDVHRFVEGRPLILGGVEIPYSRGLDGHSDADVLTHALMDALLGAAGKPDIGHRFPNSSPEWRNADSLHLLNNVWQELAAAGWKVGNLDCTLVAEAPKILPHADKMKERLAAVLGIEPGLIGIKATTAETMGALGRGEGIMCLCVALLLR